MSISNDKQAEAGSVTILDDLKRQFGELRETTRVLQSQEGELRSDLKAFETKRKRHEQERQDIETKRNRHEQEGKDIAAERIELDKRSDKCSDLDSYIFFKYNELAIERRKQSETGKQQKEVGIGIPESMPHLHERIDKTAHADASHSLDESINASSEPSFSDKCLVYFESRAKLPSTGDITPPRRPTIRQVTK